MKLLTTMLRRYDDKVVIANGLDEICGPDEVVCEPDAKHDIAVAHAVVQAIEEFRHAPLDASEDAINWLESRVDHLIKVWGFES